MQIDDETKRRVAATANAWPADHLTAENRKAILESCPEDIRRKVKTTRAVLRAHPDKVVGRDEELDEIEGLLTAVTNGPRENNGVKAQAIVGPPGAGKSTMLRELRKRLHETGANIIELTAADVTSPEKFSNEVKSHPPWNRKELWDRLANAASSGGASMVDELISTVTTLGLKHVAKIIKALEGIQDADLGPVTEALRAWRAGKTPSMANVMRLLQNSSEHGTVIIIDEGQELVSFDRNGPDGKAAAEVLRMMNDPDQRAFKRIWNVTMLLAGMQDTPEVVKGLTTVRPDTHELGAVPDAAARAMIENGIDRSSTDDATKTRAKAEWASPLTERYGDWTRHTQCAAEAARIVLDHAGARALDEAWGQALLVDKADSEREELYKEIVDRGRDNGVVGELQHVVMAALAVNERKLPETKLIQLVGTWLSEQGGGTGFGPMHPETRKISDDMIHNMKRSGLLAVRDAQIIAPIPSLMDYITAKLNTMPEDAERIIRQAGLWPKDG